jgi:hypothetical protein
MKGHYMKPGMKRLKFTACAIGTCLPDHPHRA